MLKVNFFLLEHTSITYLHNESSFRQEEWNSNEVKLDFELHYHRTMWKPRMVLENLYIEILGCVSNVQRLFIKCKFAFFLPTFKCDIFRKIPIQYLLNKFFHNQFWNSFKVPWSGFWFLDKSTIESGTQYRQWIDYYIWRRIYYIFLSRWLSNNPNKGKQYIT